MVLAGWKRRVVWEDLLVAHFGRHWRDLACSDKWDETKTREDFIFGTIEREDLGTTLRANRRRAGEERGYGVPAQQLPFSSTSPRLPARPLPRTWVRGLGAAPPPGYDSGGPVPCEGLP